MASPDSSPSVVPLPVFPAASPSNSSSSTSPPPPPDSSAPPPQSSSPPAPPSPPPSESKSPPPAESPPPPPPTEAAPPPSVSPPPPPSPPPPSPKAPPPASAPPPVSSPPPPSRESPPPAPPPSPPSPPPAVSPSPPVHFNMRLVAASTAILSLASLAAAAAVPRDEVSDLIAKFIKAESQWKQEWANTSYVLSGDSTTANGTVPNSGGWGNGFCASLVPGTPCINRAQNGATTVSFRNGGRWNLTLESAKSEVANGRKTWVTIQFGHNDMKVMSAEAMGVNLAKFVDEVRGVGAEPILITSLTRRNFNADNVTVNDTLGPWADATIAVSEEKQTHLLDLHKWSMWYVEKIGPDAAHRLNRLPDDNTHLNTNGTTVFGRMVADLMAVKLLPEIGPILPNISLSLPVWTGKAVY